jgi:hypothetical protein
MQNPYRLKALFAAALVAVPVVAFACATYNANQVSQAIQNSPYASLALQGSSCTWGGASMAESGGNTCSSNGNNFGVLQLTSTNLPPGMTSSQYMALPLQQQVDIWIQRAGPTSQGSAFNTVNGDVGSSINGYPITAGAAAACAQFGALICSRDLASLNATGQCPSQGNGGVRATNITLANGTANLDGNSQSICSWGQVIQKKIDASGCSNGNQASPTQPINCPSPTPATSGLLAGVPTSGTSAASAASPLPSTANQPAVASTDVVVSGAQI